MTKEIVMAIDDQSFSALAKDIRKQLTLSQEDLARQLRHGKPLGKRKVQALETGQGTV